MENLGIKPLFDPWQVEFRDDGAVEIVDRVETEQPCQPSAEIMGREGALVTFGYAHREITDALVRRGLELVSLVLHVREAHVSKRPGTLSRVPPSRAGLSRLFAGLESPEQLLRQVA